MIFDFRFSIFDFFFSEKSGVLLLLLLQSPSGSLVATELEMRFWRCSVNRVGRLLHLCRSPSSPTLSLSLFLDLYLSTLLYLSLVRWYSSPTLNILSPATERHRPSLQSFNRICNLHLSPIVVSRLGLDVHLAFAHWKHPLGFDKHRHTQPTSLSTSHYSSSQRHTCNLRLHLCASSASRPMQSFQPTF